MKPIVSIIVPVWNARKTLERCIESVFAQTFSAWELILSDDGSEDDSMRLCYSYADRSDKVVVLNNVHSGVSNARNAALERAVGQFICFVDADDALDSDFLDHLYAHHDADLVVCGYYVDQLDGSGKMTSNRVLCPEERFCVFEEIEYLKELFVSGVMHMNWNKLFRKEIIDAFSIRYKPYPVNEDFIFMMEYLLHCKNLYVVSKATYHWIRVENVQSGVESLPENTLGIYNQAHDLLRQFFACNIRIADEIMFFSYELIALKCLRIINGEDKTKSALAEQVLLELMRNEKVKAAYKAYKPVSFVDNMQHRLLMSQHYKVYRLLNQLCACAGKLIDWGKR